LTRDDVAVSEQQNTVDSVGRDQVAVPEGRAAADVVVAADLDAVAGVARGLFAVGRHPDEVPRDHVVVALDDDARRRADGGIA